MAVYLNTKRQLENYKALYRKKYFVDKSLIIEKLNELIWEAWRAVVHGVAKSRT